MLPRFQVADVRLGAIIFVQPNLGLEEESKRHRTQQHKVEIPQRPNTIKAEKHRDDQQQGQVKPCRVVDLIAGKKLLHGKIG
jgi:hypothetical protein